MEDFDAISKQIKNNGKTTKSISNVCGSNINLHLPIVKLLKTKKNDVQKILWIW